MICYRVRLFLWMFGLIFCHLPSTHAQTPKKAPQEHRIAFLFAHNDAGGRAKRLYYAVSDARKMRDVLIQVAGYRDRDIFLVLEREADYVQKVFDQIKHRIHALKRNQPKASITLWVYYSGHARNGEFYLGETSLSFEALRSFLRSSGATLRLAFLDTCDAGRFLHTKGLAHRKEGIRIPHLNTYATKGEAILTSTGSRENAYEDLKLRGGIFTHYLATGLRGAADLDHDERITLHELYSYAYHRTINRTIFAQAGLQSPHFHTNLSGTGQIILSHSKQTNTQLHFHPSLAGHFFLWDAKGNLYADFYKQNGEPLRLAMTSGLYKLQWRHKKNAFLVQLQLQPEQIFHLGLQHKNLAYANQYLRRGAKTEHTDPSKATASRQQTPSQEMPLDWKHLKEEVPLAERSLELLLGANSAAFVGGSAFLGGAIGLRYPFFALRLGAWTTSVDVQKLPTPQIYLDLRVEGGYSGHWERWTFFVGGYLGGGLLLQDTHRELAASAAFQTGATASLGLWLDPRWGMALQGDLGVDFGYLGEEWRASLRWSALFALRHRF
ncbi:caspase family protein [Myxococcota bacterium]|nr:caspase family protein [Myxococcota bacterium]